MEEENKISAAKAQGMFEGRVLGALDDIKRTLDDTKSSANAHIAEDNRRFADHEKAIDAVRGFVKMICGGLIVFQFIVTAAIALYIKIHP